jgi:signal transduction histidine kinase
LFAFQAAAVLSVALVGSVMARQVLPPEGVGPVSLLVYESALMVIAAQLLAGLLLAPWPRVPVADLVVELGQSRSWTLRGELARVLGDPTLEVGYWVADTGAYVDSAGRMIALPDPGSQRSATTVERDGQPVAVLIHHAAVLDDPELLDAIIAAARLGAWNARLRVQVQARIAELGASRRRILQAGDAARRRLERRLTDGAERRLGELAQTLRRAGLGARGEQTRQTIAHAQEQLTRTLEELRRLAQGLHPRALSEGGLRAALAVLAGDAPLPVEIEITGDPLPPEIEATVYFVCSEGLANVAKHAFASRAVMRVTKQNGRVRIVVEDNGIGGADPSRGSGLMGLADRVETLAGTLRLHSPPGGGTRLVAEIPIGGQPPSGSPPQRVDTDD